MTVPKGAKDCGVRGSGVMRRVGGEETRVGAIFVLYVNVRSSQSIVRRLRFFCWNY
jgi:hypothetical protein